MHHYSKKDKLLLFLCTVCYLLCILSLVLFNRIAVLLFLILHSGLFLYFFYLQSIPFSSENETDKNVALEAHQQDFLIIEDLKSKIQMLNATISEQNLEIQTLKKDKINLEAEVTLEKTAPAHGFNPEDFLLPSSENVENNFDPIDIISIAQDTISELSYFAEKANIQIQISSSSESIFVKAEASKIKILFRNIIDNSIKYMKRAGSLVITISNVGTDIFIVCKDNGSGLAPQETEHIFELNYQGSNRISGNGLGLTQAKSIVSSYGGTIYAKSTLGKGMAIYIQLPIN